LEERIVIKETVAYCGLFCEACGVYIATKADDQADLERIAKRMGTTKEEIRCEGCRSGVLSPHCRECSFRDCATKKGIANCEDCDSFPCAPLVEFQKQAPHRAELFESAAYRGKNGVDAWFAKMQADYACPKCGNVNSPYYGACKKCGENPGNEFIRRNSALFKS